MKPELTNQELLDRYIHSVKMLLPPDKMDDIAAEIRSNLQSLIDDQSMQLGRELRPDEVSAILKQHGHPMVVASPYRDRPGRGLISPELFPLYWFTLRAIFGVWVTVRVIIAVFEFQGTATAGSILLAWTRHLAGGILHRRGRHSIVRRLGIHGVQIPIFAEVEAGVVACCPASHPATEATKAGGSDYWRGGVAHLLYDGSVLALDVLGMGRTRRFQPVGGRLRDAAAHVAARIVRDFAVVAEPYALCHSRVAAVPAHRPDDRGIGARDLPAARRQSAGGGSEMGSHPGQAAGDSESDGRGDLGAGLHFCRPGVRA